MSEWLPPQGPTGDIDTGLGDGRFVDLVPGQCIVQSFQFGSDAPAFTGTMTMTWKFKAIDGGTSVTVVADNVPSGISRADHEVGMNATLANLAAFVEPIAAIAW